MNLQERIEEIKNDELEKIKNELIPHFEKYGKLIVREHGIAIDYHDCDEDTNIIRINFTSNTFSNKFSFVYEDTNLNIEEIFEEIGENLTEIKVKPANEFYLEIWKREFSERHGLNIIDRSIYLGNEMVMSKSGRVGFGKWNNYLFVNNHHIFKFNPFDNSLIKNQELADEFERVFIIVKDYLDKVKKEKPDLNKGDNDDQHV